MIIPAFRLDLVRLALVMMVYRKHVSSVILGLFRPGPLVSRPVVEKHATSDISFIPRNYMP